MVPEGQRGCTWGGGQGGGGEQQEEVGGHWQEGPGRRHRVHPRDPYRPLPAVVTISEIQHRYMLLLREGDCWQASLLCIFVVELGAVI